MVAKLPVLKGHTDTVTMMSYGFDPGFPAGAVPRRGVCSGFLRCKDRGGRRRLQQDSFHLPGYFRRMNENPSRWSQPFSALLGAYSAQLGFGLPSIGGKDSMSGTFDTEDGEINVPPTWFPLPWM